MLEGLTIVQMEQLSRRGTYIPSILDTVIIRLRVVASEGAVLIRGQRLLKAGSYSRAGLTKKFNREDAKIIIKTVTYFF